MTANAAQPAWDVNDKTGSLETYAGWINELARDTFREEQGHPEMFFFVSHDGRIQGGRLKEELDADQKGAIINREMERLNPYGTIYTRIQLIRRDRLPGTDNADGDDRPHRCLVVRMAAGDGEEKLWINPIIPAGDALTLAEAITARSAG